jgi:PIN domain nuclease of toxin-antitoxin system
MKLLLDTHILLWWLRDDPRLGPGARALIAAAENDVVVSVASLWEIGIKARIGKLTEQAAGVAHEARTSGFRILAIDDRHLARLESLEAAPDHNDPFDHLILAQAMAEDAVLITGDRKMRLYDVARLPA